MKKIVCLLCLPVILAGCDLFNVDEAFDVSHKDLLTRNQWVLDAYTQTPAYHGVTDVFALLDDCVKDNIYIFGTDGSYEMDAGYLKCSESEQQSSVVGTWEIEEDFENELIIRSDSETTYFYIEKLTDSYLTISNLISEESVEYKITQSFRKKFNP